MASQVILPYVRTFLEDELYTKRSQRNCPTPGLAQAGAPGMPLPPMGPPAGRGGFAGGRGGFAGGRGGFAGAGAGGPGRPAMVRV